ncbi:MAG: DUF1850 domain-containing protein [Desulfurococcales archaeon]|nr:DUF1850 domain-containing protein [Desulfurococcales archaeon]
MNKFFLIIIAIYFLSILLLPIQTVSITCDNSTYKTIAPDYTIIIYNWTHSVENTPIIEYYKVENGRLIEYMAKTKSFGAGHPYSAEEIEGVFYYEGDYMVYTGHIIYSNQLSIIGLKEYNSSITLEVQEEKVYSCMGFEKADIIVKTSFLISYLSDR